MCRFAWGRATPSAALARLRWFRTTSPVSTASASSAMGSSPSRPAPLPCRCRRRTMCCPRWWWKWTATRWRCVGTATGAMACVRCTPSSSWSPCPRSRCCAFPGSGGAVVQDVPVADGLMLILYGSGSIRVAGAQAPTVVADVQGSGQITLDDLQASRLVSRIDGSGRVTAAGTAGDLNVDIGGSGLHRSTALRTTGAAEVEIAGSGQALVWVGAATRCADQWQRHGDVSWRSGGERGGVALASRCAARAADGEPCPNESGDAPTSPSTCRRN